MAKVKIPNKAVVVNPLKQSQALGAALAFLGLKGMMPLLHGSQGCTAFSKVILVKHFREAIPLSTTAMTEVTTILGGEDNVEQAILTLMEKSKPEIIGLCTTGLTETRGDDMDAILKDIRKNHPELDELPILLVSSPDFKGALQDGYAAAVERMVKDLPQNGETRPQQINVLVSSGFTPGDVQQIKEIIGAFGLMPIIVPDLAASLDGHLDDSYSPITGGGTTLPQLRKMGSSAFTIALGESMRYSAQILENRFTIPFEVFTELTGLEAVDEFMQALADLSGNCVPEKYHRQRRQLQDAMLDTHFYFGRKRVSLALEPDLLWATAHFLQSMGASIHAAVTTTRSPLLERMEVDTVYISDYEDFEQLAVGSDLLIANSHGKAIAKRLAIPHYRMGIPIYDRLGNGQFSKVGYRGTMEMLFDIGNILLEHEEEKAMHLFNAEC
ncbi:MAG: nitrogenase iron-molybdenum cofactor biosynthesis protein NifN [Cyanomargarita calcarea GSE-NOS-MK-12-04C]|jgi:nitrogenase molybdenum-iron protein NifN|uniref:Nitrogenase iron-molybdenum cofactor biosynthesis protein NifN n=1 Tax=Cyanomargarita calcarea GSE-NOS-MK-12-04C TaxID=2839659 RepID=A0A951UX14_9CYAN|nr:nitrogenase iron-molybdenum cofactor biosynthesis protein NifN [Cyanomargarita calcarea GSE-NOS-MK-12-04C]